MKKSTKLITTAVALALVVAAMVVGIYAATTASSNITASVSWTAEAGVEFTLDAWTYYSAQHYNASTKSFPEVSAHKIEQIVVDSKTTNQAASGISKTLNASFIDTTDDGVNNPHELYYIYYINNWNRSAGYDANLGENLFYKLKTRITSCPSSTTDVQVDWADFSESRFSDIEEVGKMMPGMFDANITTESAVKSDKEIQCAGDGMFGSSEYGSCYVMRLTLSNPDASLASFNANVSFAISLGSQYSAPL